MFIVLGLYSRILTFFFCINLCRPPVFNPTNTEVAQLSTTWRRAPGIHLTKNSAVAVSSRNNIYTRWVRGRMKAKQRWFKVTRELCHEWFHHFRHHVPDDHWTGEFAIVIWRLHSFTISFPWWRPRRIGPQITRLSQSENSAMGTWPIYKNFIIPDWFEKWRDIKFWYMC